MIVVREIEENNYIKLEDNVITILHISDNESWFSINIYRLGEFKEERE